MDNLEIVFETIKKIENYAFYIRSNLPVLWEQISK